MRRWSRGALILLVLALGTACAPGRMQPVALTDPVPLLAAVEKRQETLADGLSGTLELSFKKNRRRRYDGRAYIVAWPDGRFRLEVPAPLGGTRLVMVSDNSRILAYYPGENRAYTSAANGRSIDPHLPFPLAVDPSILPALIMGVFPGEGAVTRAGAWLMRTGEKRLRADLEEYGLSYEYLFGPGKAETLREITVRGGDVKVTIHTGPGPGHLPLRFSLATPGGVLTGEWESAAPFSGNADVLRIALPPSAPVIDLEELP